MNGMIGEREEEEVDTMMIKNILPIKTKILPDFLKLEFLFLIPVYQFKMLCCSFFERFFLRMSVGNSGVKD